LLSRGLRSDLVEKIGKNGHTVSNLQSFNKVQLGKFYTAQETEQIETAVKREPIPEETVTELLLLSNSSCCYCADGNSSKPFQIHHIEEHSISQDDSPGNLMLVCPTHHSAIPVKKFSLDEQLETKGRWYAIAEVARGYDEKGIPFPYKAFEAIVAVGPPNLADVVNFVQLSPSTIRALTDNSWTADSVEVLKDHSFLMISGGSGAGKTTLAVGIALRIPDSRVFRYIVPNDCDNREMVREIMLFLSFVTKPTVVILDDANLHLRRDDISKIATAATTLARVIFTLTQDRPDTDDHDPEAGYFESRVVLTWEAYRPYVTAFLKENEPEVVGLLMEHRDGSHHEAIAIDSFGPGLDFRMRDYGEQAKSVWQFMFLLRAGWSSVNSEVKELVSKDRADILVTALAIEQIADAERPMSVDELLGQVSTLTKAFGGPIDREWILDVLEHLYKRRVLIKIRGRYTTVHRQWARAFLNAALENPVSNPSTEQLLARDFDLNGYKPKRLALLLSWLGNRADTANTYVEKWLDYQDATAWSSWIGVALSDGLPTAGLVASALNRLHSRTSEWKEMISNAFGDHEDVLLKLISTATNEDWEHLQKLLAILNDDLCALVVGKWDPETVATLLATTHPDHYRWIGWLFGGNLCKHSKDWCKQVGSSIDWNVMRLRLSHVRKGDVEGINECMSILNRLGVPLMRSMVSDFADAIHKTMTGASVSDWDIDSQGIGITFEFFPSEVAKIIAALDANKIAADISRVPPHRWSDLMQIFWLTKRNGSNFAADVFNALDVNVLLGVLKKYAPVHPRTLMPMLYLLKYAEQGRKKEIAWEIYDVVRTACESESDREQILLSYRTIDRTLAKRLGGELGLDPDLLKRKEDREDSILTKPLFGLPKTQEEREIFETLKIAEASGEDYDVGVILWGADDL